MFLSIKEMEHRKIRFDETFLAGHIDFSGEDLEQGSPLHAVGSAELLEESGGQLQIQGRITVEMTAQCDRCLGRARFPLDQSFDLFYHPMAEIARDEEVAIDAAEAEIGFYEGSGIELEIILREQVLLALPMQRVCSEACKGICPVCGRNRNETECECRVEDPDDRWKAFRSLKI